MDFACLPPEINSDRIYSGPGSGPLQAAAGSWDALAADLDVTAQTYTSVLSGLASLYWHGPASVAMTTTALPYIGWLHTTAEQTRQTAMQARAAAAAYELAYAMTVPPTVIAANRFQLITLIATNFFGQNTGAIAATEAQYAEYWAQDAAAMYGYAANSAAASQLTAFSYPDQNTDATGLAAQQSAVAQASGPAAQAAARSDRSLQSFYTALDPSSLWYFDPDIDILDEIRIVGTTINSSYKFEAIASGIIGAQNDLGLLPEVGPPAGAAAGLPRLTNVAPACSGLRSVTASLARADRIGSMSVPPSWAAPANGPGAVSVVAVSQGGSFAGAPGGSAVPGVPGVPGMTTSRPTMVVPRYGRRILAVMCRPPAAG